MALPSAGNPISLQQVNVELGLTATATINMGGSAVRTLFDVSSGAIDMSDGYGKSNEIGITASAASSANLQSLFDANTSGSWAGDIAKIYTINNGTTMGILTAPASMGGTLVVNNSGNIQGTGGAGGAGGSGGSGGYSQPPASSAGAAGAAGGSAFLVQSTGITINMLSGSTLSGGGGGGGNGGTGGLGTRYQCGGSSAGACYGAGDCNGEDWSGYFTKAGGAGGAGGVGAGYNQSQANGAAGGSGIGGGQHSEGPSGAGGAGGNGGTFAAAGAAGATGASGGGICGTSGAGGSGGGAGARAVTFSGVSAYTIIGTNSGTIHGAYT